MNRLTSLVALAAATLLAGACTAGGQPRSDETATQAAPVAVLDCSGGDVLELYEEWPDSISVRVSRSGEALTDAPAQPEELLPLGNFVSLPDRHAAAPALLEEVLEERGQELCAIFYEDTTTPFLRKRPGRTK